MVSIPASTPAEYLAQLPHDRRAVIEALRALVRRHLPPGYEEGAGWGMLTYSVPLARSGPTYNGQPLCYVALAAQKQHYSLYLTGAYMDPALTARLRAAFAAAGKRLDMGKSCVRFRSLDALPLDALGPIVAAVPVEEFVARYQAMHAAPRKRTARAAATRGGSARKGAAATTPKKGAARGAGKTPAARSTAAEGKAGTRRTAARTSKPARPR
jgi:hypothetical protein